MRRSLCVSAIVLAMLTAPSPAPLAQDVYAYPNKGQSQQQQEKDQFECFQWSKQQSGFDPMAVPTANAPAPQDKSTGPGLLGGAAIGGGAGFLAVGRSRRGLGPGCGCRRSPLGLLLSLFLR